MSNSPPASAERRRGWPARFPIVRVFLALIVVPIVAPILTCLYDEMRSRGDPGIPADFPFAELRFVPIAAFAYGWPGYVAFLILGVPTLYALFRRNWSEPLLFILIGAVVTSIPWLVLARLNPFYGYLDALEIEMPLAAIIGLFNGLLTRLIVLGRRL